MNIMAKPSSINPLGYIISRQYKDNVIIKNKLFSERLAKAKNLYRKDLLAHYGCVNAIEFSTEGELLVSGGDDRRVLLWSVPESIYGKGSPVIMQTSHISNIFCVAFNSQNTKILSGGNDDQVIIHDIHTTNLLSKLPHRKPVYGLHINPQNDNVVATAGDDGRILLYDIRETDTDVQCLAKQKTGFHSVMFNPTNPRFLVTSNSEEGIALWDCRKPKEVLIQYDLLGGKISGISACFNTAGDRILALRRRLPPVLYATESEKAVCQFYHPQYYNSCTMKTCCFAGDNDEYILSGSDDFNLYMWAIPSDNSEWGLSHIILKGHRSIVNQVRYNKHNNLIASSGVEKMVKLWSTLPIGTWKGSISKEHLDPSRFVYSHEDYVHLVGHGGERISHDYSDQSTQEDAKMMAFFDSLIQREIEGWNSSTENSLSSDSDWSEIFPNNSNYVEDNKKYNNKSNRIAQLIFKKRNRLAKMAHNKCPTSVQRHNQKINNKKNNVRQKSLKFQKVNGEKKKNAGGIKKEAPKQKYITRQSVKHQIYETNSSSNNSIDAPSTSTGITNSNNSVYRVIEQDSEEESTNNNCEQAPRNFSEHNFVNILPTPLNGTHDLFINVLEVNNGTNNSNSNGNVVTVRNEEYDYHNCASTSNGGTTTRFLNRTRRRCNNCLGVCEESLASTSSYIRNTLCSTDNCIHADSSYKATEYLSDTDSGSDEYEFDYRTPVKKKRSHSASDSGCATGPSSSSYNRNNHQECSPFNDHSTDDEEYHYEKFKKRTKKARINIRKKIVADSDSN